MGAIMARKSKAESKERSEGLRNAIANAENQVDKLLDYLPPEHPRVIDAKKYVAELESM